MNTNRRRPVRRIFVGRLAGTSVFDPLGDKVGVVHDVVVLLRSNDLPRAVGLVVEVTGRRRIFLPLTRVTAIEPGAVISTGLLNLRRFQQRSSETLVMAELIDRQVAMRDGSGQVVLDDVAIEQQKARDWMVTSLAVRRLQSTGLFRRGETLVVPIKDVVSLFPTSVVQSAATFLATTEDFKAADLAELLHELPETRRLQVAAELPDSRLADVLEELTDDDRVSIITALEKSRAADVLDEMQPDDAADLISELPDSQAEEILGLMEPDDAADVRRLLSYHEDSAGGLMTSEPLILTPESTVATALAHARRQDVPVALAAIAFVVRPPSETPTGRFLGAVHLQRLLREPPHLVVGTILDSDIETLHPDDPLGKVTRLMATYNLTAVPVVDENQRLLGAVSVDDVLDNLLPDDWRYADDPVTDQMMLSRLKRGGDHG